MILYSTNSPLCVHAYACVHMLHLSPSQSTELLLDLVTQPHYVELCMYVLYLNTPTPNMESVLFGRAIPAWFGLNTVVVEGIVSKYGFIKVLMLKSNKYNNIQWD